MKKNSFIAALLFAVLFNLAAYAQAVVQLPISVSTVTDLGNGAFKLRVIQGNAYIFTTQSSGIGGTSGLSTTLTLTTPPATPPCTGCIIAGSGITSGTTVTNAAGAVLTLSAAMTVPAGSAVSWGAACPATISGLPTQYIQAGVSAGYYVLYTQARICAGSPGGFPNTLLIQPIDFNSIGGGSGVAVAGQPPVTSSTVAGTATVGISIDSNFSVNGSNQLALAPIASGSLIANCSGSLAEPTLQTWSVCMDRNIGSSNGMLPLRAGGVWGNVLLGNSVGQPGTATLEMLLPVQTNTTNGSGSCTTSCTFASNDLFKKTRRSNSGSAMSDTFPASGAAGMVNGARIVYVNSDATASSTITAGAGTSMSSGGATDTVGPGRDIAYDYDLASTQWRRTYNTGTALLGPNNLSEVTNAATARANLGLTIGTNVEAWDVDLDCIAALAGTGILRRTGSGTCSNGTITSPAEGGTGQSTVNAARQSSGLNVWGDAGTGHGDVPVTIGNTERFAYVNAAFTASRAWTLPAANVTGQPYAVQIGDMAGGVTGTFTLVITRAGSDTINGGTTQPLTTAFGGYMCYSDGVSKWLCLSMGIAGGGGGISSVTPGGGLASSTTSNCAQAAITSSGTLSAAICVNAQTGTSYAIADSDRGKLITASNAAAQAYTIAQASTSGAFFAGWCTQLQNNSTLAPGIVTITATTSQFNNNGVLSSTLVIRPGFFAQICSDGVNYQVFGLVNPARLTFAWVYFTCIGGCTSGSPAPTIVSGWNISSISRGSAGTYTFNFTVPAPSATSYVCNGTDVTASGTGSAIAVNGGQTAAAITISMLPIGGAFADPTNYGAVMCNSL